MPWNFTPINNSCLLWCQFRPSSVSVSFSWHYNLSTTQVTAAILRIAFIMLSACASLAQDEIEEITVIGVSPLSSTTARDSVPYVVQFLDKEDIRKAQAISIADLMQQRFAGISVNDAQNNPLQPDVHYRGFTVSPLLGLAQGIAVYQNGFRINEPLGDAVNWDLLPTSAISTMQLSGGTNPVFGLNSLGGAITVDMKNGFDDSGHHLELTRGSFDRGIASIESSSNNGTLGYYLNLHYFEEDGWRDHSESRAENAYLSLDWRNDTTEISLNLQKGRSDLTGNGSSPVELLHLDRSAIFTGPDITTNDLSHISLTTRHNLKRSGEITANLFYRENKTDAFNGDGSEFTLCQFDGTPSLLNELDEDDLDELALTIDDLCRDQFSSFEQLEIHLDQLAQSAGTAPPELTDLTDQLSGSGRLSDQAINNLSNRNQISRGFDIQWTLEPEIFGRINRFITGISYFRGTSSFNAKLELSEISPQTRLTTGLGTGSFLDSSSTNIDTETSTSSFYFRNSISVTEPLTLIVSARFDDTRVKLIDRSGQHAELNGSHRFLRLNPSVGLNYQINKDLSLFASVSEASRAPTPIELACNDQVFTEAQRLAEFNDHDPQLADFECRLPNAFLADPPLDEVITSNLELGLRGQILNFDFELVLFDSTNRNDILFQSTGRSTGLFANLDESRRNGFESVVRGGGAKILWFASYSFVDARFEDDFDVLSPNHTNADEDGNIRVKAGDLFPGTPRHLIKAGIEYNFTQLLNGWLDVSRQTGLHLRGDESNELSRTDAYTLVNAGIRFNLPRGVELFGRINNLFDTDYESFGLLGESPSDLDVDLFTDFENPRYLGPGAPRGIFIGFRLPL